MKIGILGGTFSPIHDGHLRLAKTYQQELGLEKMLLIPTYQPPHKHTDHLPDGEHRCRMAERAPEGCAGCAVSDIEIRRGGKRYTVDTLEELRQLYPDGEFYLLTGSDMFCTVLDWHRGAELVKLAEICTMERGGDTAEMLEAQAERIRAAGGKARIIHKEPFDCSSTEIRERIAAGCRDSRELGLDPKVLSYILQNGLYGSDVRDWVYDEEKFVETARRLEKPGRFQHSMNVADRAEELAGIYGENPYLCRIAGILHDVCKNLPEEEQFSLVKRLRGPIKNDIMNDNSFGLVPPIWHGPAAAAYIWETLGVYNREILYGVAYHTTGRTGMSLFEKIVYIADLTSAERDYPDALEVRELADRDLDAALRCSLEFTLKKMRANATPMTRDTLEIMREYGIDCGEYC